MDWALAETTHVPDMTCDDLRWSDHKAVILARPLSTGSADEWKLPRQDKYEQLASATAHQWLQP